MILVSNFFCQLFDKTKSASYSYQRGNGLWTIHEKDESAKLTDLDVVRNSAEFIGFNQKLTKSMPSLTIERSTKFKDKECDGIAFVKTDNREDILFVELKSKYDTSPVSCAIEQICFSFLKMHSMLSLCNGYSLDNLDVFFCVATRCAKNDNEKAKTKFFISQALMRVGQEDFGIFFQKLFMEGQVSVMMNNLLKIMGIDLPLHEAIKNKKVTLFLVTSQNSNDKKAIFNY